MGNPTTEHIEYGTPVAKLWRSWEVKVISQCDDIAQKRWKIRTVLQVKATSDFGVSAVTVSFGIGYERSDGTIAKTDKIKSGTITPNKNDYVDIVDLDIEPGAATVYQNGDYASHVVYNALETYAQNYAFYFWIGSIAYKITVPYVEYGGIDYTAPNISYAGVVQDSETPNGMTVKYSFSAPYDTKITFDFGSTTHEYTDGEGAANRQRTVNNLSHDTKYNLKVIASCANGKSTSYTVGYVQTTPIYVTGITATPSQIDIDIGEEAEIRASVSPNNATDKSVTFAKDSSNTYYIDSTTSETTRIHGKKIGHGTITITAVDKGKNKNPVSKDVTVNVYKPAVGFNVVVGTKELVTVDENDIEFDDETGEIVGIRNPESQDRVKLSDLVVIYPNDSTDTNFEVDYFNPDNVFIDDEQYAYALSPVSSAVAFSLSRREKDPLFATITIEGVSERGYDKLDTPDRLSCAFCDLIYRNIVTVSALEGITISGILNTGSGSATPPSQTGEILNQIEAWITQIYGALPSGGDQYLRAARLNYGSAFNWTGTVQNPKSQVQRWIAFLDSVYWYYINHHNN